MKFYDRNTELSALADIKKQSESNAQLTVLTGRRRVGKTRLIIESFKDESFLYFFISKKTEKQLCQEFTEQIKSKLEIPVFGEITKFKDLIALLLDYSKNKNLTLIIDEFQEWYTINPAVYSEMQNVWDLNKETANINLIVMGSVFSLMKKIFENSKEPLFGRANERIYLKPFSVITLKKILKENNKNFDNRDLLAFYILTGGIPKYVELFVDKKALSFNKMVNEIFRKNSYFIDEGKNLLIEEFGKEYTTYFAVLSLIASSKTSRPEIESILEKDIGGYLERLENEYSIIRKVKPIFAKPNSRTLKYYIDDNFLNFWFRFIYKNSGAVEIENFDYLKTVFRRDFNTFSGKFLEKYFRQKLELSGQFSHIGNYWEKGNKNEIDIVAMNERDKKIRFAEVKLNPQKISLNKLKEKSAKLQKHFKNYKTEYFGYSMVDM